MTIVPPQFNKEENEDIFQFTARSAPKLKMGVR